MGNEAEIIITLLSAIVFGAGVGLFLRHYFRTHPQALGMAAAPPPPDRELELERLRARERAEARALYERVVREKLDVIKTAVTMGYSRQDLAALDARLEQLIGTDKLQALLATPDAPAAMPPSGLTQDLLDTDIAAEIEKLSPRPQQREG